MVFYDIMSRTLTRFIGRSMISHTCSNAVRDKNLRSILNIMPMQSGRANLVAQYSKGNGGEGPYKTVGKGNGYRDDDIYRMEGELNWELTSDGPNRFYLPDAVGPAWQGDSTTTDLMEPLETLVNFFKDNNTNKERLELECCRCPFLLQEAVYELFPLQRLGKRQHVSSLLTLSYEGDIEIGAIKFVLAAREICNRLKYIGHWADFITPFSGRPFVFPEQFTKTYKLDYRLRGVNMSVTRHNGCVVMAGEENDKTRFSGTIFTTAPSNYLEVVKILAPTEFEQRRQDIDKLSTATTQSTVS